MVNKGGNSPRRKGHGAEREVCKIARDYAYKAERTPGSKYPDVRLNDRPVSVKRRKSGLEWIYTELETHDYVLYRIDNKRWLKFSYWQP